MPRGGKGGAAAETPLFRQYQGVKEQHPDKVLLFRMGDFYELFYSDAGKVAALLGLTLTSRRTSTGSIPMAGVPAHSVDQYVSRLVRLGESVVICDQVGEVAGKGIMERRVTQVVTPGTLTDSALLEDRDSSVAMAVHASGGECGYAWLDLARGELRAAQCRPGALADHFARLSPAEVLVAEGAPVPAGVSAAVRHLPEWDFEPTGARARMCDRFGVRDLRGFGLEDSPLAVGAAMALLGYAEETQCRRLDHLWSVGSESDSSFVALDAAARRGLELTSPAIEGGPTLLSAVDRCRTPMGSRLLASRIRNPLRDSAELDARLDAAEAVAGERDRVAAALGGFCDLERVTTRVLLERVRPRELAAVRDLLAAVPALAGALEGMKGPVRERFAALFADHSDIAGELSSSLAENPSAQVRDGGVIADGHDAELDRLRGLQGGATEALRGIEERERERTGIAALRVGSNRVHGYYLELPRSLGHEVPEGFRRRQTTKHAERYVTDELVALEREAADADAEALAVEKDLYERLVRSVGSRAPRLRSLAEALADLDVAACMAGHAAEGWVRPSYGEAPVVRIRGGRHPVVERSVGHFVPNDTSLGRGCRMEVVTGPNMGGKSTYMRQVALIALLARIGAPVPAAEATVGDIDAIMTRIGSSDDLAGGRSTFMVEMSETAAILRSATERSLVILDEIGRGTSTFDGLSLAWATAETLLERSGSLVLLATHYLEMTELAEAHPSARNVHLAVGEHKGEVIMLHRIEPGASSRSFGIQVAKMAGVPDHALSLARERLAVLEAGASANGSQGALFGAQAEHREPPRNPALELLRNSDPEDLTPRQAQELLFELRALDDGG